MGPEGQVESNRAGSTNRESSARRAPLYAVQRQEVLGTDKKSKSEEWRRWAGQCGALLVVSSKTKYFL